MSFRNVRPGPRWLVAGVTFLALCSTAACGDDTSRSGAGSGAATSGSGGSSVGGSGPGGSTSAGGSAGGGGSAGAGGAASGGSAGTSSGPHCGDGERQIERGERCDDGATGSDDCTADCQAAYEVLFDERALPSFYIEVPQASWDQLGECTRDEASSKEPPPECDYQQATFYAEYDATPDDADSTLVTSPARPVGIRRKGRATWSDLDDKPSWKLKFTEFGGEQFLGLSRLTLNNLKQDPSGLHERLGYELFRAAGVLAPLANNARVFLKVGDEADYGYVGLYSNIQTVDKQFADFHFGDTDDTVGNLYDTFNDVYFTDLDRSAGRDQAGTAPGAQEERFQLETNETPGDKSDLTALLDAVYVATVGDRRDTFWSEIDAVLDRDEFLDAIAMMAVIGDWDGFASARNNYKLYHEVGSDRFLLIPWGIDQTFGQYPYLGSPAYFPSWGYPLDHGHELRGSALFLQRCLDDTENCEPAYRDAVTRAAEAFESAGLTGKIPTLRAQIEPHVEWDADQFDRFVAYLTQFVETRGACVDALLAEQSCAVLTCPGDAGECMEDGPSPGF